MYIVSQQRLSLLLTEGGQGKRGRGAGGGAGRSFNNIAVFLKFQFAYFDVRRCRSTNQATDRDRHRERQQETARERERERETEKERADRQTNCALTASACNFRIL